MIHPLSVDWILALERLSLRRQRRSQRTTIRMPLIVSWTIPVGSGTMQETTATAVVSGHGALIHLRQELALNWPIEILNKLTQRSTRGRVAWVGSLGNFNDPFPVGIELSVPSETFWAPSR
jgi:hypothetical protein